MRRNSCGAAPRFEDSARFLGIRARVRRDTVMTVSASSLPAHFPGLDLSPNERLVHSFRPDVDDALRFSPGLVLLSDARLLVRQADGSFRGASTPG